MLDSSAKFDAAVDDATATSDARFIERAPYQIYPNPSIRCSIPRACRYVLRLADCEVANRHESHVLELYRFLTQVLVAEVR